MDTSESESECNNRKHAWIIARCRNTTIGTEGSIEL
jgi:hypothetical protein